MFAELVMCAVVVLVGAFLGFTMLRHFDGTQADPELAATDPGLFLQSSWDCSVSSSQWSPTCGSTS
ncbi:MAG: hypothetical protein AB7O86_00485 [Porticoccaceae bacterium]|jgi:hypothetical protein